MLLAKEALMEPIDIDELQARGPANRAEELRLELYDKVNALGIGAQGLGGLTTVLDVKIGTSDAAARCGRAHPNCAQRATSNSRSTARAAVLTPPRLEDWPQVTWEPAATPAA